MNFIDFFYETVNYNLDDFSDKWNIAISESEELRIALEVMGKIAKLFPDKDIFIVGGVPRDLLMGNTIDDVDMATNIPIDELKKNFELRNISKNDSQPVYALIYGGYSFDLAKFREDSQSEAGRQNNIAVEVDSFEVDSARRDITINSFGIDHTGRIVDYQGGLDDLKNKIIRAVGNAKERFKEDATRILRVFRFAAKMDFDLDPDTEKAAIQLKHLLKDSSMISQESIAKEFYKVAKSGKALANFLIKLDKSGILQDVLPEFTAMNGFTHNPIHHPEGGSTVLGHILECLKVSPYTDPKINLAVLFHDFGKATTRGEKNGHSTYYSHESAGVPIVQNIFDRLKFNELSAQDKKDILSAVNNHMHVHNLNALNIKTLSKLILDPSWETVKSVGYCDEASRGTPLFDADQFNTKIEEAEGKVQSLGSNADDLRIKIKQYLDGNRVMQWFPSLMQNKSQMKYVLQGGQDFILNQLNAGMQPTEEEIKAELRRQFSLE
jgi:tRNA nucleotidyltransferase/poly(A) polymerase